MQTQKLAIENENNKLACHAFVEIGPDPGTFTEDRFNKLYSIEIDGESKLYYLVDFIRVKFGQIGSVFTIPAAGVQSFTWRDAYRKKHPNITNDSQMAVYFFQRH